MYWILPLNSRSSNGYSNESLESLNLSTEDPESDREMDIEEENEEIQNFEENEEIQNFEENEEIQNAEEENSSEFHNNKQKSEVEVDEIGDEVEPWRLIWKLLINFHWLINLLEEKYQALNPKFQVPLVLEFLEKKKNRIKKTKGKRKKNIWTTTSLLNKWERVCEKKKTPKK